MESTTTEHATRSDPAPNPSDLPHIESPRVRRFAGASLLLAWVPMTIGEALYDEMDSVTKLTDIVDPARMEAAALLQLLSALLLIPAAVTVMHLTRRRAPVLAWLGGGLTIVTAVAIAAFSQFHLLLAELTRVDGDTAAVNRFLADNLTGFGAWSIPILLLLVGMTFGIPLLVAAAWRAGVVHVTAPVLAVFATVLHMVGSAPTGEVVSHALLAGAIAMVGVGVWRRTGAAHAT